MASSKRPTLPEAFDGESAHAYARFITLSAAVSYRGLEFTAIVCSLIRLQLAILPQYRDEQLAFTKKRAEVY